eukprot:COSAG02_NODE_1081_length_14706_cov_994.783939_13_plen_63_part_00
MAAVATAKASCQTNILRLIVKIMHEPQLGIMIMHSDVRIEDNTTTALRKRVMCSSTKALACR